MECLFLSNAGPKSGCLSYLIAIIGKETSDVWQMSLISVRYDQHPLFGPALDKNNPSTTRRKNRFFFGPLLLVLSVDLFFSIIFLYWSVCTRALKRTIFRDHMTSIIFIEKTNHSPYHHWLAVLETASFNAQNEFFSFELLPRANMVWRSDGPDSSTDGVIAN